MCNSTFCSNPTHLRRKKGYPGIHKNQPLGNRINNNNNNKICLIIKHNHPQWNWNERKNHNSTMLTMWNRVRLGTGNSVSFRGKFWQRCMMSQWRLKWLCYGIERETQNNKKNVENKSRSEVKHTLKKWIRMKSKRTRWYGLFDAWKHNIIQTTNAKQNENSISHSANFSILVGSE